MIMKKHFPVNKEEIKKCLLRNKPFLFSSSQTSTVLPFSKIESDCKEEMEQISLTQMKPEILISDKEVHVSGMVTWQDLIASLRQSGKDVYMAPTERMASVLAGISTSASGERSFSSGSIREQLLEVEYLDYKGEVIKLDSRRPIAFADKNLLKKYQEHFAPFKEFKNGPFPRLEYETDLMVGTEGQLGVILSAKLKCTDRKNITYLAFPCKSWIVDFSFHIEFVKKVQNYRDKILSCEILDKECLKLVSGLPTELSGGDVIFLEVLDQELEKVSEKLLANIPNTLILSEEKFLTLRSSVPRSIAEYISKNDLLKKGTDIQVSEESFSFFTS